VAETDRRASAELRKKSVKTKKDRSALVNRFGPGGNLATGLDQYNRWVLQQIDPETGATQVVYLLVEPNGRDWEVVNGTEVIKRVKTAYGNQENLRKILFDKGYMSENDYTSKSVSALNGAIIRAATEFSTEVADSYTTEGKMKFPTFQNWITTRGAAGEKENLPRRDINLEDRDVIRSIIESIYIDENMQLPDDPSVVEAKVDRYMDEIKKGVRSETKKVGSELVTTTGKGVSESRIRAELTREIPKELPMDYQRAQSLNFLSFLDQMEQR